jgi:aspartyl-tRNA(Asn)/glutamyl-tRNA(Gln) amidotransferase subunit C
MIEEKTVRYVAKLAHLSLSAPEVERLTRDLSGILDWMKKLDELDTTSVVPTAHAVELPTKLRDDAVEPSVGVARALANAPEPLAGGFGVPKIIE